jgi:hypothetical protein
MEMRISIYGPAGLANYTPPGIAIVEHFDPYSNRVKVESFSIGGTFGPSSISVVTGSLNGLATGEVKVQVTDNEDLAPGSPPSSGLIGRLINKLIGFVGAIDDGISGIYAPTGY